MYKNITLQTNTYITDKLKVQTYLFLLTTNVFIFHSHGNRNAHVKTILCMSTY